MSETATTTEASTAAVDPLTPEPKSYDEAYVKELRQEAAAARVAKKEAVEAAEKALKEAHSAEIAAKDSAYTELQNEHAKALLELQKLQITVDAKVPSEKARAFAAILQGTDEESIGESLKSNLDLFGTLDSKGAPSFFDPTQGRGGVPPLALNGDPILEAIKKAVGV